MTRLAPLNKAVVLEFAGVTSLESYIDTAIEQATILLETFTCRSEFPEVGTLDYDLMVNAIADMSLALYYSHFFKETKYNPYQSETIGSYSYSKVSSLLNQGLPTNVGWFDQAIQKLNICGDEVNAVGVYSDAVTVFENDGLYVTPSGRKTRPGPADFDRRPYLEF